MHLLIDGSVEGQYVTDIVCKTCPERQMIRTGGERESQGNLCIQEDLMMMMYIYIYI